MAETEETENLWWAAPRFLMSAVAVLLLIIVGIILFVWVGNDDESDAAPPAQTQAATPTPSASLALDESVCGLDATGGTTLTSAPEDVEWEFLGGIAAPKSADHGPGVVDEQTGVRSCYSHTPQGALLAATGRLAASGNTELLLETTKALSLEGPGKDIGIERIQRRINSGSTTTPPIEIEGFRLLSYNDDEATVEVVASGDSGSELIYYTTSVVMEWHQGDWYVKYKDDGSAGPVDGQISDLSGYSPWGPNSG